MSVSCNSSPTLTSTGEIISETFTTTTTPALTTLPPTTTTSTSIQSCPILPSGVTAASPCLPSTVPITITIPGETETVQVPITMPVEITSFFTTTLWGTSCTTIDAPRPPPSTPPSTPPTAPSPPVPPVINSSSASESTTPVITTERTETTTPTQSNASVTTATVTSTPPPVNTIASNDKDTGSSGVAPIVGGAVGGFFGLIAIVALIWFILKRRRRWDDIFEKDDDEIFATGARRARRASRLSLDVDVEPKPYQYGLVGQAVAPSAVSPPHSPSIQPSVPTGAHSRVSSLTPLNLNVPMSTSAPLLSATTASSRPSTGGSAHPLYPVGPPQQQAGYFALQQQQPNDLGRSTSGANTIYSHSHSHSSISYTSPPVSHAHWNSGVGAGYSGDMLSMAPLQPASSDPYPDRSGSPTSIQEIQPRRLQVVNAIPTSPVTDAPDQDLLGASSSSAAAPVVTAPPQPQRDGKGRVRTSQGESSSSAAAVPPPAYHE